MAWVYLLLAGLCEIGWAIGLKLSDGFTRPLPSLFTAVSLIVSLGFLALALRGLPLGAAYAVWTGIGILGTATAGMILYGEPVSAVRLACIGLILIGIAGLKITV